MLCLCKSKIWSCLSFNLEHVSVALCIEAFLLCCQNVIVFNASVLSSQIALELAEALKSWVKKSKWGCPREERSRDKCKHKPSACAVLPQESRAVRAQLADGICPCSTGSCAPHPPSQPARHHAHTHNLGQLGMFAATLEVEQKSTSNPLQLQKLPITTVSS